MSSRSATASARGGQAHSSEEPIGLSTLFTSVSHPNRFRWASDPESLAIISSPGRVRTLRSGDLVVSATTEGVTGSRTATVVPSRGTVRYVFPAAIRRGDTVQVEFRMLDEQGVELPPVDPAWIRPEPKNLIRTLHETTPGLAAFVALSTGSTTVTWCFAGRTGMERLEIRP